jgi:hypothetical protein
LPAKLKPITNPNMKSDLTTAIALAKAALEGALANVEINLDSLKDEAFVTETRKRSRGVAGTKLRLRVGDAAAAWATLERHCAQLLQNCQQKQGPFSMQGFERSMPPSGRTLVTAFPLRLGAKIDPLLCIRVHER